MFQDLTMLFNMQIFVLRGLILNNADVKRHIWFYFDLDHNKWLHLNGLIAQREIRIQVKRQELEQIERYSRQFSRTT